MKPQSLQTRKLKLAVANDEEPTRQQIAMARIEQEHRESKWTPIDASLHGALMPVDDVQDAYDRMLEGMIGKQWTP